MQWVVRVARNMDDVKECYFTDKEEALKHVEALKKLSMAVDDANFGWVFDCPGVEVKEVE